MVADLERWLPVIVLLVTGLVFLPSYGADFVWDDHVLVVANTLTGDPGSWGRMLWVDLWASSPVPNGASGYYRPLVLMSWALDRQLWGLHPGLHHLHGLAWHLLATGLLWRLGRSLGLGPWSAGVAMILFAVHPAQVESVMFVAARNDPMAAALLLGALLLLSRERPGAGALFGGGLLVLLAAMSKESAVLAPLCLAVVAWARWGGAGRVSAHLAAIAGLGVYGLLRLQAGVPLPEGAGLDALLRAAPVALGWLWQVLLWPVDLLPGRSLGYPGPETPWLPWLLAGVGVCLGLAWSGGRRAVAGLAFMGLTLAPALAGIAQTGLVADRYLCLPLAGLGLALGAALGRLDRPGVGSEARVVPPLGLLGLGALGSSMLIPLWRDDHTLWSATLALRPTPYVQGSYAKLLEDSGDLDGAARYYALAVQPREGSPLRHACFNVSAVQLKRRQPVEAFLAGELALDHGCPRTAELLAPMAVGAAVSGRWERARSLAEEVLQGSDPTGYARTVLAADRLRQGDETVLDELTDGTGEARTGLRRRAEFLLRQAGEDPDLRPPDAPGSPAVPGPPSPGPG